MYQYHNFGDNPVLKSDGYKPSHALQYPKGTTKIVSYLESRGGLFPETTFFGLQGIIKQHLLQRITRQHVDRAEAIFKKYYGNDKIFDRAKFDYIVNELDGRWPVRIFAVREGTTVPTKNILMRIENTDPNCYWVTNYLETILMQIWYPITVATYSRQAKKVIKKYLEETGDPFLLQFKLHDFGFRGVSSYETSAIGAAAHLVNFDGTDTISGIEYAMAMYEADVCGFSIPASEHSTITSWCREGEIAAYENMLNIYPTGFAACVSDSWDIKNAVSNIWGGVLKEKVLQRDGTLVIRPDSGDPVEITLDVVQLLWDKFGGITNSKGYKVLDPHVRIIQGDGVDLETIEAILANFKKHGFSADNIAFGSGGKLLQAHTRDDQKFAIKCCFAVVNGVGVDVYKDPATDPGKVSKKGVHKLAGLYDEEDKLIGFETIPDTLENEMIEDLLELVYEKGELIREQTFEEIRNLAQL